MLELREVFNLDLHARLTVLSDGAALSMRDAASELGIVQWAWRPQVCPGSFSSRWPSDDADREAVVRELQKELRNGKSPDEALLAARQQSAEASVEGAVLLDRVDRGWGE